MMMPHLLLRAINNTVVNAQAFHCTYKSNSCIICLELEKKARWMLQSKQAEMVSIFFAVVKPAALHAGPDFASCLGCFHRVVMFHNKCMCPWVLPKPKNSVVFENRRNSFFLKGCARPAIVTVKDWGLPITLSACFFVSPDGIY